MGIVVSNLILEFVGKVAAGSGPHTNADADKATWYDNVGSSDATLYNFSWTGTSGWDGDGTVGDPYRLRFDSDAYTESTGDLTVSGPHSWEVWMHNTNSINDIFNHNTTNLAAHFTVIDNSGYKPLLMMGSDNWRYWTDPNGDCVDGELHHWVLTTPGNGQTDIESSTCYLDGNALTAYDTYSAGGVATYGDYLRFGYSYRTLSLAGGIATYRAYNKVLSSGEAVQNYNAGVLAASSDVSWTGLRVITPY